MASALRSIQKRILKKAGVGKLPIVNDEGQVKGSRFGFSRNQILWAGDQRINKGDTHPTLQPLIDALS